MSSHARGLRHWNACGPLRPSPYRIFVTIGIRGTRAVLGFSCNNVLRLDEGPRVHARGPRSRGEECGTGVIRGPECALGMKVRGGARDAGGTAGGPTRGPRCLADNRSGTAISAEAAVRCCRNRKSPNSQTSRRAVFEGLLRTNPVGFCFQAPRRHPPGKPTHSRSPASALAVGRSYSAAAKGLATPTVEPGDRAAWTSARLGVCV